MSEPRAWSSGMVALKVASVSTGGSSLTGVTAMDTRAWGGRGGIETQ